MIQTKHLYVNAAIGNSEEVLQDIHLQAKNIAIYQRDAQALDKELQAIIDQTIECRASGTVAEVMATLKAYFNDHLPNSLVLFDDIALLLELFRKTTQASSFRLLLATVSTNMCRKFHTDINNLRLLCTYIGPGTLWLPDEAIDYEALRKRGSNQQIVKDEQQIQQVNTGDVTLLKGALYPKANPILHRSPSIEAQGVKRLLLRIDTNELLDLLA
ncbi:MAG: DUF1826 domain-containing protein [Bacteroidota bacterium]